MKGKVLGFDPASGTGAITGDDGNRYSFAAADNKSPAPLKPNDTVDFEVDGNAAKNIYAVKTGFSMPTGGGAAAGGGAPVAGGDFVQMLMARPSLVWCAVIILGSLIAGYLSVLGGYGGASQIFGAGIYLTYLLILIPVAAGVQLFFELTNHAMTAQLRFITAVAAIAGPIVIPILVGMMLPEMMSFAVAMGGGAGILGFAITPGVVITVGGGVLLLLTHLGIIKKLG